MCTDANSKTTEIDYDALGGTTAFNRERYLPFGKRRGTDDLPSADLTYLGARSYDPAIAKLRWGLLWRADGATARVRAFAEAAHDLVTSS
ncbi:MAG TPA: hypothetical protein VM347_28820 [Nonomuraea sp.]|nr:hypothetical protein [Nonomuraea sp.]